MPIGCVYSNYLQNRLILPTDEFPLPTPALLEQLPGLLTARAIDPGAARTPVHAFVAKRAVSGTARTNFSVVLGATGSTR